MEIQAHPALSTIGVNWGRTTFLIQISQIRIRLAWATFSTQLWSPWPWPCTCNTGYRLPAGGMIIISLQSWEWLEFEYSSYHSSSLGVSGSSPPRTDISRSTIPYFNLFYLAALARRRELFGPACAGWFTRPITTSNLNFFIQIPLCDDVLPLP